MFSGKVLFVHLFDPNALIENHLFYDWTIADDPNYRPDLEQNVKELIMNDSRIFEQNVL